MEDQTGKSDAGAGPTATPPTSGCLALLGVGLFIFGGMAIDFRIMTLGIAAFAAAIIAFLAAKTGLISERASGILRLAVIPCGLAFWAGVFLYKEYIEYRYVVPTREYNEYFPSSVERHVDYRYVELTEESTFHVRGAIPVVDGATAFVGLYDSVYSAVRAADSRYMIYSKTPGAYQNLINGTADLIFVFRPSEKQIEEAAAKRREFAITPVGHDAFVFFVNRDNPVDSLSTRQVRDIYSGKIRNWREVGGRDEAIAPFQRYEGSGSQSRMERFMAGEELMTPDAEYRFEHMLGIVRNVARYRNYHSAIGYSFYLYVEAMLAGGDVKLLGIDGVVPSTETIRDGSYPLVDEVCIVTAGTGNENVAPLIEWVLSPQGQAVVGAVGYVPIAEAKPGTARLR